MRILFLVLFLVLLSSVSNSAPPKIDEGFKLVWADEFEKDGKPNPKNWIFENGFKRNNEAQWYQEENAYCKDGKLIIEGRKEKKDNPTYKPKSKNWKEKRINIEYTSASVISRGLQSWQYGRFEIKAKIKTEEGLWPAIWFLGVDGEWPSNGEIDLMEYYNGKILANACWGTKKRWNAKWDSFKKPVISFNDKKWDEKFHIWRMDWDSDSIKLYVDGLLLNTINVKKTINPTDKGPKNPFRQPHYILLNLALGGNNGGSLKKTTFPSKYEIEYVRVYQKENSK